jgi:hypothetical protein
VVLPNGTFMLADPFNTQAAQLNASTLTWTLVGTGKADANDCTPRWPSCSRSATN